MSKYRTLEGFTEDYFKSHPEEIESFLMESFAEYAKDNDSVALLSQLRVVARVKGISSLAEKVGMTSLGLQKALSVKGNPRLDNIQKIMRAMGYQLMPQKMDANARI